MRIFCTGGSGYVGSLLVPWLLADKHEVTVYDAMYFGNGFLPKDNANLKLINGDIRDVRKLDESLPGHDAVIHLACISNDTSCQLDEALSTSINYHAFEPLVMAAKAAGVRRFIYCSSSSVYGISDAPEVYEDHPLLPVTLYNKYKGMCEPLLFKHQSPDFVCVTIRPATVCGYAPRMRFDLTVNILTNHAVQKGVITVFGGNQRRPNLHIKDMCEVYKVLLNAPDKSIAGETFNVGYRNMRVSDIALLVQGIVDQEFDRHVTIETKPSQDNRSYHVNSEKIMDVLGFRPRHSVESAVREMCVHFKQGEWKDSLTNKWFTNIVQYQDQGVH